jgi:hypothetical protein
MQHSLNLLYEYRNRGLKPLVFLEPVCGKQAKNEVKYGLHNIPILTLLFHLHLLQPTVPTGN